MQCILNSATPCSPTSSLANSACQMLRNPLEEPND